MVGLFVFAFAQLSRFPDTVINFRTQMTTSYAELGETCVATTAQLGIVIFFCCAYATATFRTTHSDPCGAALRPVDTVMSAFVHMDVRPSTDATFRQNPRIARRFAF